MHAFAPYCYQIFEGVNERDCTSNNPAGINPSESQLFSHFRYGADYNIVNHFESRKHMFVAALGASLAVFRRDATPCQNGIVNHV